MISRNSLYNGTGERFYTQYHAHTFNGGERFDITETSFYYNMRPYIALTLTTRIEPNARIDADLIEIRLDLIQGADPDWVYKITNNFPGNVILTLRSREEGGRFAGTVAEWSDRISQYRGICDYIDIEGRFSPVAPDIHRTGNEKIVASCHMQTMPDSDALQALYIRLVSYGDIPKIAVAPGDEKDLLRFASFTVSAKKPVITSIMGEQFRWARPFLVLLGSAWTYCHAGEEAAAGQYHIDDMKALFSLLL